MPARSGRKDPRSCDHPYVKYEGGVTWKIIDRAIADLVANGDLVEKKNRKCIVGFICSVLAKEEKTG